MSSLKPVWHYQDFMLLCGGQFVSYIGTQITTIALPLIVLALTGSPAQAGIVAGIRGLTYILWAIPAGALIDRWDRKKVMLIGNLGSGVAMLFLALSIAFDQITLLQLYLGSFIEGSFFVFANLARYTSFIRVLPKEKFASGTALWTAGSNVALLIGPPLGGFLYQTVGAFMAFVVDALSYFLNIILIFLIKVSLKVTAAQRKAIHHEVREGMTWLWNQSLLRFMNLSMAGRNMLASGLYLLIIVLAKELNASTFMIGIIFAAGAIGGIVGALISAKIHHRFTLRQLLVTATLSNFLLFLLFFAAHTMLMLAVITTALYVISPLFDVTASAYIAGNVPDEIKGRVSSLTRLLELGATSFGFFVTGILLEWTGSIWTIAIFSVILFVLFLSTVTNKQLTRVHY